MKPASIFLLLCMDTVGLLVLTPRYNHYSNPCFFRRSEHSLVWVQPQVYEEPDIVKYQEAVSRKHVSICVSRDSPMKRRTQLIYSRTPP
ncbi:hypothetical protein BJY52DRAFT_1237641, partial [Lactarius psammicola]